jgi:hypothetical protein
VNIRHGGRYPDKLIALTFIPVIALAILGITYSHWQETLTVNGTVTTGYVKLVIGSEKVLVPQGEGYDEYHPTTYYKTSRQTYAHSNMQKRHKRLENSHWTINA